MRINKQNYYIFCMISPGCDHWTKLRFLIWHISKRFIGKPAAIFIVKITNVKNWETINQVYMYICNQIKLGTISFEILDSNFRIYTENNYSDLLSVCACVLRSAPKLAKCISFFIPFLNCLPTFLFRTSGVVIVLIVFCTKLCKLFELYSLYTNTSAFVWQSVNAHWNETIYQWILIVN